MVYDVPRNFVGDTHWKADEPLAEGDELNLEKDGILVQVEEQKGQTETNLSELRHSARKNGAGSSSPARGVLTPARRAFNGPSVQTNEVSRQPTQLKHRSLNALLGTPRGPVGKAALPTWSPFEQRQAEQENEDWEDGRPAKRHRTDDTPAWNVTRTTTTPRPNARKETPLWARTADAAKQKTKKAGLQPGQQMLGTKEVIDLSDLADIPGPEFLPGFSSDVLQPPSSSPKHHTTQPQKPAVRSSSPAFQTQKQLPVSSMSRTKRTEPVAHDVQEARPESVRRISPSPAVKHEPTDRLPDRAKRRLQDDGTFAVSAAQVSKPSRPTKSAEDAIEQPKPSIRPTSSSKTNATLRIASSAPKKKGLACLDLLSNKPKRLSSTRTDDGAERLLDAASPDSRDVKRKTQKQQLEERLKRICRKKHEAISGEDDIHADSAAKVQIESEPDPFLAIGGMSKRTLFESRQGAQSKPSDVEREHDDEVVVIGENTKETAGYKGWTDNRSGPAQRPKPAAQPSSAKSFAELDLMLLQPKPSDPDQLPADSALPAKRDRNFRRVQSEVLPAPIGTFVAPKQTRQLQRVMSESDSASSNKPKRVPGAPMRFTPSPAKRSPTEEVIATELPLSPVRPKGIEAATETEAPVPQKSIVEVRQQSTSDNELDGPVNEPKATAQTHIHPHVDLVPEIARNIVQKPAAAAARPSPASAPNQEPMPPPPKPPPQTRRKVGVGRKEVRKAAAAALDTSANGTSTVVLNRPFQAPKPPSEPKVAAAEPVDPKVKGPWSREAFDLFTWRPPGWDEEAWCVDGDNAV